jgi:hypothetical protein
VICGAPSKVLYRASWAPLDGSALPSRLEAAERVVAEFDWADIVSEAEAGYRRVPNAEGRIALKLLPNPAKPERDLFDAGRHTPEGSHERFTLHRLRAGHSVKLVVRAAPVADLSIPVVVDGKPRGMLELPRSDGWIEIPFGLGKAERSTIEVELGTSRDRVLYHLWAVESP